MWCWRKLEITWTHRVANDEVLRTVKEKSNILCIIKRRKADWIGHILHRNYLLRDIIEGKTEDAIDVKGSGGKICRQLLTTLR
jgi:hypothetical protein